MVCPNCGANMLLVCVEDCEDESGAYEEQYACPQCGTERGVIIY